MVIVQFKHHLTENKKDKCCNNDLVKRKYFILLKGIVRILRSFCTSSFAGESALNLNNVLSVAVVSSQKQPDCPFQQGNEAISMNVLYSKPALTQTVSLPH